MSTNNVTREEISALMDNALPEERVESVLAALSVPENRAAWSVYHQIGDVLRSDDMDCVFSADFAVRMAARLEAEPAIVAPVRQKTAAQTFVAVSNGSANPVGNPVGNHTRFRRFALPAVAAAATVVAIAYPQWAPMLSHGVGPDAGTAIAVATAPQSTLPVSAPVVSSNSDATMVAADDSAENDVVMRDPRIDEYLRAHQRFSPSLYSTAQYTRSAAFASDSDK